MLTIDLTKTDRIVIGNITVQVTRIQRGKVQLGVTAPKEIRIDREEIAARRAKA